MGQRSLSTKVVTCAMSIQFTDRWMPRAEVARILNVSRKTLYRLERKGQIDSVRVTANKTLVDTQSVQTHLLLLSLTSI
jgi:excisionase family DNA binding protein